MTWSVPVVKNINMHAAGWHSTTVAAASCSLEAAIASREPAWLTAARQRAWTDKKQRPDAQASVLSTDPPNLVFNVSY